MIPAFCSVTTNNMLRLSRQALRWSHRVRLASRGYTTCLPAVTKIEKIALDSIKVAGPLSFAQYMQLCLAHPTDGYYMNPSNSVFGRQGDFITSPEISQIFGEVRLCEQPRERGR